MGMMNSAMKGMLKALPVQERETLMLKMMPDVIKQADMAKMMPGMLKEFARLITLYSLYEFLRILLDDDEIQKLLEDKLKNNSGKLPAMMEMMHPMMISIMPTIMPKMMKFMATMMPNLQEIMPQMMEDKMIPMIEEDVEMKEHMLGMMQTMFPHCATNLFPMIEKDQRIAFINKLFAIMTQSATVEMNIDEKQRFHIESARAVKEALPESYP
jgi:hypothetical protein